MRGERGKGEDTTKGERGVLACVDEWSSEGALSIPDYQGLSGGERNDGDDAEWCLGGAPSGPVRPGGVPRASARSTAWRAGTLG